MRLVPIILHQYLLFIHICACHFQIILPFMIALPEFTAQFDAFAAQQFWNEQSGIYEPVRYIMSLGGKRLRPYAAYVGYQLHKEDVQYVLPLAYTLELFHNFTLVHDDIMDEAPLRRGQPTVHMQFGMPSAILSGDVMMIHCYRILHQNYPAAVALPLMDRLTTAAIGICEGQQEDMDFEKIDKVSMERYINMIRSKTAILLGCAFQCGAIAGGATEVEAAYLEKFGTSVGVAFQIQDDILDVFGGPETGKQEAGDIVQKKKNYLYVKSLELLDPEGQFEFVRLYQNPHLENQERVEKVLEWYKLLGVQEYATTEMERWSREATAALIALNLPTEKSSELSQLAKMMMSRKN